MLLRYLLFTVIEEAIIALLIAIVLAFMVNCKAEPLPSSFITIEAFIFVSRSILLESYAFPTLLTLNFSDHSC